MFENKTFENILSNLLDNVNSIDPKLDTRIGSIMYNALAPIALELETAYHEMDMILEETFLETASKEYLIKHGNQLGLNINSATSGHFIGEFNVDVEIGSRFNLDEFNYSVISKVSDPTESNPYYIFELVCETAGSEPNSMLGDLTPITYVANLSYAKLTSVIIYGEDEEETEAFRYRLHTHVKNPPVNGNVSQYDEWLADYDGIGKFRTIPCWNGSNTVKLLILNPENESASTELITQVQEYFDPPTSRVNDDKTDATYPQGRGMGNGQAPIGAIITVDTATSVPVVINCELVLKEGYSDATEAQKSVEKYIESLALNKTTVAYMPIAAAIYNSDCVKEVTSLSITVNGTVMDTSVSPFVDKVTIGNSQVAVLDTENSVWSV
jgi:uncharacterized phage protein gp47/JayE